jgi:diguanylate cyclase (GGDEF)-like protein
VERSRQAIARLGAALVAPLAVGLLRLFPATAVASSAAAGWLPAALYAAPSALLGLAAALGVADGLRRASAARLLEATAIGAMAAAFAAAALRSLGAATADGVTGMPDAGLPPAVLLAGAMLLVSRAIPPDAAIRTGRGVNAIGVFVGIEATLAASLLITVPPAAWPWLLGAAAVLAGAAAFPGGSGGSAVLAGGLAALAMARPGSVDVMVALLAMAAAGILLGWPRTMTQATVEDDAGAYEPEMKAVSDEPMPGARAAAERHAAGPILPDDEAVRLARELRGTIEELLHARRTIELQREEIARGGTTDPLTGVANRRAVLERLRLEVAEARRYAHPVAALIVDVDDFGRVNAEHSLAVGDAVLRELALRLRLRMREADALGRIGGDAFLAILPHTDERGAAVFADAVRRRLTSRPVGTDAGEVAISVSIGVAFVRPGMSLSDEEVLAAAEEALASARAAGGNRIAFDRLHGLVRIDERRTAEDSPRERGAGGA